MDVCQKQDPVLWRARLRGRRRCDGRLGDLGQADVPGCVDVKLATGRPHQQGAGLAGPQQGLLQGPDEVGPEQLRYLTTHRLIGQVETDAGLAHRACHPLFIGVALGEVTERQRGKKKSEALLHGIESKVS